MYTDRSSHVKYACWSATKYVSTKNHNLLKGCITLGKKFPVKNLHCIVNIVMMHKHIIVQCDFLVAFQTFEV